MPISCIKMGCYSHTIIIPKWRLTNMKISTFIRRFLRCGLVGWCMEILFTAAGSLRRRDYTLKGCTSLWMFPIYGSASFLYPLFCVLKKASVWVRGFIYMLLFFFAEFLSGSYLKKKDLCPWDYNRSKWNINRITTKKNRHQMSSILYLLFLLNQEVLAI